MITPNFPQPPSTYSAPYIQRLLETVRGSFSRVVSQDEAVPQVYLLSPGGKVFAVTVSDTGTLSATQVPLGR